MRNESTLEVNVLVPSFNFESLEFIVWDIVDTIYGTSLNSDLDCFIIVTPLLKYTRASVLYADKETKNEMRM